MFVVSDHAESDEVFAGRYIRESELPVGESLRSSDDRTIGSASENYIHKFQGSTIRLVGHRTFDCPG